MTLRARIEDIFTRFLDRFMNGPLESKVGWPLVAAGLTCITTSKLFGANAKIDFDLVVVSGTVNVDNANETVFLVFGIFSVIVGLFILFRSVLSPRVARLDAMTKISELLSRPNLPENNAAIQAQFQRAYHYATGVPEIRKIMLSDNPELFAIDYKVVRALVQLNQGAFVLNDPVDVLARKNIFLKAYWPVAIVAISSYASIHFPFWGGLPSHFVPWAWGLCAVATGAQIWILSSLKKYSALQRVTGLI